MLKDDDVISYVPMFLKRGISYTLNDFVGPDEFIFHAA